MIRVSTENEEKQYSEIVGKKRTRPRRRGVLPEGHRLGERHGQPTTNDVDNTNSSNNNSNSNTTDNNSNVMCICMCIYIYIERER